MINPFFSLIIIVLSVFIALFYVVPLYGEVRAQQSDLQVLKKTLQDTNEINGVIDETVKTMNSIDPGVMKRLDVFMPPTLDSVRFVNNIYEVGTKNHLVLNNIKIEDKKGETPIATIAVQRPHLVANDQTLPHKDLYATTKISFDVIATYAEFQILVDELQKNLGLVNIKSLVFEETKDSDKLHRKGAGASVYLFKVEFETYSLK